MQNFVKVTLTSLLIASAALCNTRAGDLFVLTANDGPGGHVATVGGSDLLNLVQNAVTVDGKISGRSLGDLLNLMDTTFKVSDALGTGNSLSELVNDLRNDMVDLDTMVHLASRASCTTSRGRFSVFSLSSAAFCWGDTVGSGFGSSARATGSTNDATRVPQWAKVSEVAMARAAGASGSPIISGTPESPPSRMGGVRRRRR